MTNYANRTWIGTFDYKNQQGSVIGILGDFLKKHPEIVANKDAFYKKGGYLNGMYFNNDCINSLENPKNGFFVKETDLTLREFLYVIKDLKTLGDSAEARLVQDTILAGMSVPEYQEYKPSEINVGWNDYAQKSQHHRFDNVVSRYTNKNSWDNLGYTDKFDSNNHVKGNFINAKTNLSNPSDITFVPKGSPRVNLKKQEEKYQKEQPDWQDSSPSHDLKTGLSVIGTNITNQTDTTENPTTEYVIQKDYA